ncbi:phosphomethylpyrimidine kinase [Corallococcus sp. CA047B]|uniref:bifunctional hydroxymethylpyrimidine kinase/phosphomethylpyrimidine kinase n=1 Tax=Corallococcus sp. CA047B TaxID=2316729 RepID=UPI000EA3486F|nr:bifunctional hydroxymethylpyrimidine kinase/phosphomethylpyrimidine kinase [Corallococcus sp. CA047B]RKG96133.1 phosphomethylpyrimidine kinase [Corallococcus sp. CA047B]
MRPRVLLLAGLEPTGRAGLLADVAAVRARGGDAVAVPTAQTAQGTHTFAVVPAAPRMLTAQVTAAREWGVLHAVKWGVVPGPSQLATARAALKGTDAWWVVDPVVRSSRGQALSRLSPRHYLALAGPRVVVTPNLDEAGWLLGRPAPGTVEEAQEAAEGLCRLGFGVVLVKGGHLPEGQGLADVLAFSGRMLVMRGRRLKRPPERRGTGCRLASALAAELGRGTGPEAAVRAAREHVTRYLRTGRD